jgi:hypothetical protein
VWQRSKATRGGTAPDEVARPLWTVRGDGLLSGVGRTPKLTRRTSSMPYVKTSPP